MQLILEYILGNDSYRSKFQVEQSTLKQFSSRIPDLRWLPGVDNQTYYQPIQHSLIQVTGDLWFLWWFSRSNFWITKILKMAIAPYRYFLKKAQWIDDQIDRQFTTTWIVRKKWPICFNKTTDTKMTVFF